MLCNIISSKDEDPPFAFVEAVNALDEGHVIIHFKIE